MAVTFLTVFLAFTGSAWGALVTDVNLAHLHGVASANDSFYDPSLAIDADWETNWAAPGPGSPETPFWLQVDLQKRYQVDRIVLVFAHTSTYPGYTNIYNLYISVDGVNWSLVQSGTLVDSTDPAVYVTTIPLATHQTIRYARYEVVGGSHWATMFEMEIWGDPVTANLAHLRGVASANATYLGNIASLAIDADWETCWAAPGHGSPETPYWLQVDLQKKYQANQIKLVGSHNPSYPGFTNIYNLYTSVDGLNWSLVQSGILVDSTDPAVYVHTIPLAANQIIRYARYEVVGGSHWANLYEMEIWGEPMPFPRPIVPSLLLLDLLRLD
jgi:hypothetical protein